MRVSAVTIVLRSSVALGALVLGSAANAACTTANGVVTCTNANTSDQVNGAVNNARPPSVTLTIARGATVTRGNASSIGPNSPPFDGAIGYVNDGIVGTTGASVDFRSFGSISPTSTATLTNRGTQNGGIFAFNYGGAINFANSGTITGGVDLSTDGPIVFSNTGSIYNSNNTLYQTSPAIRLTSSRTVDQFTQNVRRIFEVGSTVTATIGGTVVQPATSTLVAIPQSVYIRGAKGAEVTVTGQAGAVSAGSIGQSYEFSFANTPNGNTYTLVAVNDSRSTGGDVRGTIGANGSVTSLDIFSYGGAATAMIDGRIRRDTGPGFGLGGGGVSVTSGGGVSTSRQTEVRDANTSFQLIQTYSSASSNTGKAASVEIGATGRTDGSVSASSNAGAATVRVAGTVGSVMFGGGVSASSTGVNTTGQRTSVGRLDGTSDSMGSSNQSLSGGAALVSVAATGEVGGASATGDTSATVDNAGRIRGGVSATSSSFGVTTAESSNQSRTITNGAAGTRTVVDQSMSNQTTEVQGGAARVINAATGFIGSYVQIRGVGGAIIDNAGTIASGVSLSSFDSQSFSTNNYRSTTTTTPVTGGGVVMSNAQESSNTVSGRSTGGAATGTYGGTVGTAQSTTPGGYYNFSSIDQSGATSSAATITGTAFANFDGFAGATNSDSKSGSTSRFVSQPSGAYTRDQSNTFAQTVTQNLSNSTLVIGATGQVLDNGTGTGNVSLQSDGGDARFTLDGGRVDGSVSIAGAAGFNTVQTSDSSSSYTRGPSQPNVFVPEVQQSQTNNSTFEQRAARGTGRATVNSGTIGGDLFVSGTGAGAGTLGANVLINGTVTGGLTAVAFGEDTRTSTAITATRNGPNGFTRTQTATSASAPSADSGDVLVAVNGTVGAGILASAGSGSAVVNLAGRAGTLTPLGVAVVAYDFTSQTSQIRVSNPTSTFFSSPLVSLRSTSATTPTGGTATLNVVPTAAVRTSGASSIEGDVAVQGFAGSTLNLAAGSRILQNSGTVFVGGNFNTTTAETIAVVTNGVQTGSTGSSSARSSGGPAAVVNAGIIGSTRNPTTVSVASVGGAGVANAGTINGSVFADARGTNRSTTTTTTNSTSVMLRRTVATNVFAATGGTAAVDNSALVTGGISAIGATGTVTNSGVVRGAVTLGGGFSNFNTTVTTTFNPTTQSNVSTTTATPPAALFNQTYRLDQNGFLLGGVTVTGASTIDVSGGTTRTSNAAAAINLNNGSITLGNISAAANTVADVTLNASGNGSGFLGVAANDVSTIQVPGQIITGFVSTPSLTRFAAIDPALGVTMPLVSGSRISGVRTVTKAGDGIFVIVGAPVLAATATMPAVNTLDVATLRTTGGELQLGLAGTTATANIFGITGNVDNMASLVVGRRITDGTQTAVRGINVAVGGNLNNASTGNLVVGVNPSFFRPNAAAPFVPFGGSVATLASTNSFVRVDGNLTLAGTVNVLAPTGGIYEAGRAYDVFSVGGSYANTGTVRSNLVSPFISFTLTPRSEGGRTVVSLDVARANFDTVATDRNAAAAARALQAALPGIANGLRAGSAGSQDFASVIAALDTQFTAAQSAEAFRQLSSGEFYGSLAAISTTAPFGEATDGLSTHGASGVGLWFRPTGQFATYEANEQFGASGIDLDNYGGSIGLDYATAGGAHIGIAGGYGALNVRAMGTPERATARTYMAGLYAAQQLDHLHISGQAVYGRSDWDASRGLPIFGRTATGNFKSTEVRASLRVAYAIDLNTRFELTPFARGEVRYFRFDGFDEQGAGSIGLAVGRRSKAVFNPEVGLRIAGSSDTGNRIRPFAEGSYVFQGNPGTDRLESFLGNRATAFSVQGVRPGDAIKAAIGVIADVGPTSLFVRTDYASGGKQQVGSVRAGALLKF